MSHLTRRAFTAAAAALTSVPDAAVAAARWEAVPSLPWIAQEIYGAPWRGLVLVAGGMAPAGGKVNPLDRAALYDPTLDLWRETAPLPFPRHHPVLSPVVSERYASAGFPDVFALGGYRVTDRGDWTAVKDVLRFDLAWTAVEPMPKFQCEAVAIGLYNGLHVIGGRAPKGEANAAYGDHADVDTHQVYFPDLDQWTTARPLPMARNSATGALIGEKLYVAGGCTMGGGNTGRLDCYDAQTDRWETLRPMPVAAGGLAGTAYGDKLYVFGGEGAPRDNGFDGVIPRCWSYDPAKDEWMEEPAMRTPRHGLAGVALTGGVYAIGGGLKPAGAQPSNVVERLRF